MPSILNDIVKKIKMLTDMKNSFGCNNSCPYYDIYREDYHPYKKDNIYSNRDDRREDIKISIAKLIKDNEKYFTYEIERTTLDCLVRDTSHLGTMGYSHKVAYEIFKKYGIFMYIRDLITYVDSPRDVKYKLQTLVNIYGIEKVTEEIAIYLRDNYPKRFGIRMVCKQ